VTQLNSPLGPDGRQDFEGVFPPLGWKVATSRGAPVWNATSAGALSGTRGSASAQAGSLAHNQWTELRTPLMTMTGSELLSFSCYISSEDQYDGLKVYVYDANDNYVTVLEGPLGEPLISGNSAVSTDIQYPASHPKTIAVGASTDCDMRSDYSAYGPDLDFLAPSSGGWDDITTTDLMGVGGYVNGDYTPGFGGTSAACPLAAGIGALVLSVNSELTASEVRTILRNSCDKIGGVTYDGGGWNEYYGYGRVNAQRALQDAYRSTGVPYVNLINPANNAFLFAPTNVVITASAGDPDGTIRKVEFFDGAVKLGEDTTAPYALTWAKPPHGEHTLLARVTDNDGKTNYSAAVTVTVAPGISISDAVITEGNSGTSNVVFSVRLSAKSSKTVSVSFAVGDGTAVPGRDYVAASGILVFAPGITNRTIRVPVIGDRLSESNNTFFVNLANPINAGLARRQGRGIIRNNDAGPALSINDVTVTESDSGTTNAVFTVRLSTRSGKTISVNYSTASGSAQGNLDFVPTSGVVTFPPGVINQSIVIPVLGDTLNENDEGFFVNLSRPVHASIAQSQGLGVIVDDDPAPFLSISDTRVTEGNGGTTDALFAVNLSAASAKMITVNYATAGLRKDIVPTNGVIKFPPGATNRVIRVAIIGDTMSEDDETFLVNLGNAANAVIADGQAIGTIVDNDPYPALTVSNASVTEGNSGATNAIFTVRLSAVSGRIITVDYATANGTAVAGSDYVPTSGTVVFPAGTSNQTIRVAVTGEKLSESNETFFVNLTNPINANIADAQGMATIFGVDPLPALSINNASVTENDDGTTDAVFAVRLSTRSGKTITVNYATANGTALAGSDYVAQNGTLTFPPGVTNLPVTVTINDDGILETNETFTVILTAPVNATIADNRGVGTILDNDFKIMAAQVVGTNVLIRFPTLAGRTSRIEYCEQPLGVSAAWITVPGAANIRGTGEVVTGTHFGGASRANCFYRIHLLP
jgi:hypothetical protein